ncbi:MAG: AAA domain-containing protein, partial [Alphaproteobacteria bacterium]|nr:AAA domain-containing protein [Alphaproteobacteria bacterium]
LQEAGSFEDLFAEAASLEGKIVKNSRRLWLAWLQMRSCGLDKSEKDALKQYLYLLSGVTGARNWSLNTSEWERYMSLWAEVSDLIGRWAVTSLSAKSSVPPLQNHFDIVVFDEASQCDIASALPLLYRARAAVVIGDPKQLPPISRLKQKQDERLLKKHGLYEEWSTWAHSSHSLHPSHSLYDLASMLDNPVASLREHYRSHSDIINFSNSEFYQRDLIIATRYGDLLHPAKGEFGIRWVDVRGRARRPRGGGAVNQEEAAAVVRELTRLVVESGYGGSVGVVSPFRVQAEKIGNLADAEVSLRKKLSERKSEILSDTVHRFQGDERDVIIFSPVVSEGMTETAFDFLRNNRKLFNVAVTRARAQLIVVGDRDACKKIDYLARLLKYIDSPADSAPETSDWERLLDEEMCGDGKISGSGVIIKRQHPVDGYYLDFALIIGERCLAIEVDGEYYHRDWNGDLCRRDQIRNRRLMELGWDVMRFWVYEIRDDMPRCIARIQEWLDKASGSDTAASN